jgi:hypothetical protein
MKVEALIPLIIWLLALAVAAWVRVWTLRRCEERAKKARRARIKRQWTQEERDTYEWLKNLNNRAKK